MHNKALSLFFQSANQALDLITKSWRPFLNPVLPALSAIKLGKALHGHIVKSLYYHYVSEALPNMYAECGELDNWGKQIPLLRTGIIVCIMQASMQ